MTKLSMYHVGDLVLFRYEKATKAGRLTAIFPSLDRLGRITTRVVIKTTYTDMGDNEHTANVSVCYSAIVGLQEQEREVPL